MSKSIYVEGTDYYAIIKLPGGHIYYLGPYASRAEALKAKKQRRRTKQCQ